MIMPSILLKCFNQLYTVWLQQILNIRIVWNDFNKIVAGFCNRLWDHVCSLPDYTVTILQRKKYSVLFFGLKEHPIGDVYISFVATVTFRNFNKKNSKLQNLAIASFLLQWNYFGCKYPKRDLRPTMSAHKK